MANHLLLQHAIHAMHMASDNPNWRFERDSPKAGFACFRPAPQAKR